jgi:hypothetical protein
MYQVWNFKEKKESFYIILGWLATRTTVRPESGEASFFL